MIELHFTLDSVIKLAETIGAIMGALIVIIQFRQLHKRRRARKTAHKKPPGAASTTPGGP